MRTAVRSAVAGGALAVAAVLFLPGSAIATGTARSTIEVIPSTLSSAASPTASPSPSAVPPTTAADPYDIRVRTFSYGRRPSQRMDVWWHPTGPRRPAVFVIHGGWWSSGDKKYLTSVSRSYAELGYTVVNLNYRLSGEAAWPAQCNDAISAISAVRRHARTLNTDPNRYVVLGFSAGGHIATALGTYGAGLPGLRGVVGISPVVSPLTAYADGRAEDATLEQRKLRKAALALAGGCSPRTCPRRWAAMEVPFHVTPGDAPVFTVHSSDEFVPPFHSELLKQALAAVGVPMTITIMPGEWHSAPLYRAPGVAEEIQSWIAAQLDH